jgi:multicopper oxidase
MGKAAAVFRRDPCLRRRELLWSTGAVLTRFGIAGMLQPSVSARAADAAPAVPGSGATTGLRRLQIGYTELNPDGRQPVRAVTVDGGVPGPELRLREGELFRVQLENDLPDQHTSIHWHGLVVPAAMDGVPDISMTPVPPQQIFLYEYPIRQSGTYWYHSHVGLQEQSGLYGPIVIEPKVETLRYDRDYVVMLSDWLHRDPDAALAGLRGRAAPDAAGMAGKQMAGMAMHKGMSGMPAAGADMAKQSKPMAMPAGADLSDLTYDSFLLNGRGNQEPWAGVARPGDRVRLRLINAGSSTFFRVMIDGHPLTVVHADGIAVRPVEVDWLLVGMAETYDVLVDVAASGSFTIRAEAQDGSGQALGVLHTPDVPPRADSAKPKWGPRQLAYGDLVAAQPTPMPDGPSRAYALDLTGDMASYVWSINDQVWPNADPLTVRPGERVEVTMTNRTGMWHPMHLHGHFFRLLDTGAAPDLAPLKHTVSLPPNGKVRVEFLADNPGRWFFHCHNLYHMETGMAREWLYTV